MKRTDYKRNKAIRFTVSTHTQSKITNFARSEMGDLKSPPYKRECVGTLLIKAFANSWSSIREHCCIFNVDRNGRLVVYPKPCVVMLKRSKNAYYTTNQTNSTNTNCKMIFSNAPHSSDSIYTNVCKLLKFGGHIYLHLLFLFFPLE